MTESWTTARLNDKETVRRFLNQDRTYNAYPLADLDDVHWPHAHFIGATKADHSDPTAVVLRYVGFEPHLLVLIGDADGVAAILAEMDTDTPVYFTATEPLYPVLQQHYQPTGAHLMWRMIFEGEHFAPALTADTVHLTGAAGAAAINELFADRNDDSLHFAASQIEGGAFYGIFAGDQLIAVAGTHVVSPAQSVAGVGNIYTQPEQRGQGLATRVTAATTARLLECGIQTIILNVKQRNKPAVHVYEKLGYRCALPFWEGIATPIIR